MGNYKDLEIVYWNIKDIVPFKRNPKKHPKEQVDNIAKSLEKYGWRMPCLVNFNNGELIAGHGRILAAKQNGMNRIPCIDGSDMTQEQIDEFRYLDNKLNESAWDNDILKADLPTLDFSDFNIDWGVELDLPEPEAEEDDYEVELPEEPKTKLGQIWQLGRHRLMCGDSTDIESVQKLTGGCNKIDLLFTDPPYNVSFNGRSGKFDVIKNDDLESKEFEDFIVKVIGVIKYINPKAYYIWCNWKFYAILQKELAYKACIVWAKNVFGLGKGYRHQHEFCLFNGEIDEDIKNESDLWEIKKDSNYLHPTQKPVELSYRAIGNHKSAKTVLDLFGGSGSTLIGCEQRNVDAFIMELDPKYCDVIIDRWEKLTGDKAVLLDE